MSCECLDVVRRLAVNEVRSPTSPSLAVKNSASPKGWSQKWAHKLSTTANHSRITTSNALRGLPWAQGVVGSNPAAPTNTINHLWKRPTDVPAVCDAACDVTPQWTAAVSGSDVSSVA